MKKRIALLVALVVLLLLAAGYAPQPATAAAIGDCNSSGTVSNNDIIVARNHLYDNDGSYPVECDANQDNALTAADLHCIRRLVQAQLCQPATWNARLGTNLNAIVDYSPEYSFANAFKGAREWRTRLGWSGSGWGTDQASELDLDENGYVRSLPQRAADDTTSWRWAMALLFIDIGPNYPTGTYHVLYDGTGTIYYGGGNATKDWTASALSGHDVLNVVHNNPNSGIEFIIAETDPQGTGDYIRNIRILMPGFDPASEADALFHPDFLDSIAPFKTIRFMDWMVTNRFAPDATRVIDPADGIAVTLFDEEDAQTPIDTLVNGHVVNTTSNSRSVTTLPDVNDAYYSTDKGAPVEVMVELANQANSDPWFNMPDLATDAYVTDFATYVYENLEPSQRVYVEYSNETWNGIFEQSKWITMQGEAEWPNANVIAQAKQLNWYGKRTHEVCKIWDQVFGLDKERVICLVNMQGANTTSAEWLIEQVVDCELWDQQPCSQYLDAIAIAPYIGNYLANQNTLIEGWLENGTPDALSTLFDELNNGGNVAGQTGSAIDQAIFSMDTYADVAAARGLDLISYEGGQHLHSNDKDIVNPLFLAASNDARMEGVYDDYLEAWPDAGLTTTEGGKLFLHFNNTSKYGASGAWGSQESYDDDSKPKLDALLNYNEAEACNWPDCDMIPSVISAEISLPNTAATTGINAVPISLATNAYELSELAFALSYDESTLNFSSVSLVAGLSADFTLNSSHVNGLVRVSVYPTTDTTKSLPDGEILTASFTQPGSSAGTGVRFVSPQAGGGVSQLPASCGNDFGQAIACEASGVALASSVPTAVSVHETAARSPRLVGFALLGVLVLSGVIFGRPSPRTKLRHL